MKTLIASFVYVLLTGLLPLAAEAQSLKPDSVYLKSGSVVYGRILESDSLAGVTIINECGLNKFQPQEIQRLGFGNKPATPPKKMGYYNLSTVGLLFGEGRDGLRPLPSFTMVNGLYFNQKLHAGIGFGFEYYDWVVMPLFASAHYFFNHGKFSPYAAIKVGYSIPLSKGIDQGLDDQKLKNYGGALLSPELGITVPIGQHNAFILGLGYHFQELSEESYQWWSSFSPTPKNRVYTNYNRVSFRLGFIFR